MSPNRTPGLLRWNGLPSAPAVRCATPSFGLSLLIFEKNRYALA